jgi:hypothetical protein
MTLPNCIQPPFRLLWTLIETALLGAPPRASATMAAADPALTWLWRVRSGDLPAQREYIGRYWSTVEEEAVRYARRGGPLDDLRGEGALALWEAAFTYDPKHHRTNLDRYVENRIHQRVRRAYVAAMGYEDGARVTRLTDDIVQHGMHEDPALSTIEWLHDVTRAADELAAEDRAVILTVVREATDGSRSDASSARERKRLQRARRRLRKKLRD